MWNIYQEEYDSPFRNTGNTFHSNTFTVEAYSWDDEVDQKYNFKWRDYEITWYKYFPRGMTANRVMSPSECAEMLDDCLEEILRMNQNLEDEVLFDLEEGCIQCGSQDNLTELENGKMACENCLTELALEQRDFKDKIENEFYELGFTDPYDLKTLLETSISLIKYAQNNTTIETLGHLIKSLEAININIKIENELF